MTYFCTLKTESYEAYFSAIQQEKEEQAWFQGADVFGQWPWCDCIKKEERT